MSSTIALKEPSAIVRGDTAQWRRKLDDYPPATWTLSYNFVRSGDDKISHTAIDNSDGTHLAKLTPATTSLLTVGAWRWAATVTDGTDRFTVGRGSVIAEPDYVNDTAFDPRSFAERMVDILRARLERRASSDVVQHAVEGFSMSVMTDADARAQLQYWERRVDAELAHERQNIGLPNQRRKTIYVQMS